MVWMMVWPVHLADLQLFIESHMELHFMQVQQDEFCIFYVIAISHDSIEKDPQQRRMSTIFYQMYSLMWAIFNQFKKTGDYFVLANKFSNNVAIEMISSLFDNVFWHLILINSKRIELFGELSTYSENPNLLKNY